MLAKRITSGQLSEILHLNQDRKPMPVKFAVFFSFIFFCISVSFCAAETGNIPENPDRSNAPVLSFSDGSNNRFLLFITASGSGILEYMPMQPENSSSGFYSGGVPASADLAEGMTQTILEKVDLLEKDTEKHLSARKMGSGIFVLQNDRQTRKFIVEAGETLESFRNFLAELLKIEK